MKRMKQGALAVMLCSAMLLSACGKDGSSSSRPQQPESSSTPPSSSSAPASSSVAPSSGSSVPPESVSSSSASSSGGTQAQSMKRGATVRADGGLRLRASASEKSDKLLTIPDGTHIVGTGWSSGWVRTTYDGRTGYVSSEYLLFDATVHADGGLRLRSGPGETYDKLLTIPNGTAIVCLEQADGWVKTTYDGKTGYVSQEYLRVSGTVRASVGLNLRAGPDETTEKLLTIPNGTDILCYGNKQDGWIKVGYGGKVGYVSYLYVSFD